LNPGIESPQFSKKFEIEPPETKKFPSKLKL